MAGRIGGHRDRADSGLDGPAPDMDDHGLAGDVGQGLVGQAGGGQAGGDEDEGIGHARFFKELRVLRASDPQGGMQFWIDPRLPASRNGPSALGRERDLRASSSVAKPCCDHENGENSGKPHCQNPISTAKQRPCRGRMPADPFGCLVSPVVRRRGEPHS